MTAPVIDSVTPAGPVNAIVGSKVTFSVIAHDADTKNETVQFVVIDQAGNPSNPQAVQVSWSDPLTLQVTASAGSPVVVNGMTATVG